jgi:chaperone required for assembly of F1-ATPase
MKRFYRTVAAAPGAGGHAILLDGKPVRTPDKAPLALPTAALAERVAAEWAAQEKDIQPETMPLTQLANTAIDRLPARREAVVAEIAGYAGTDLVCYRADRPVELAARQAAAWQPLLDWLEARHAARLAVVDGLLPAAQPDAAIAAVQAAVAAHDDFALAALHLATGAAGSVVIALALAEGEIDPEAAFAAAHVDELFQVERWGEDAEAAGRRDRILADLRAAADFIVLCRAA